MDVVNAILKPIVDILMVPVKKHLGYVVSCTQYVRKMDLKNEELNVARNNVQEHIKRNKLKNLEIPSEVDGWLEKVVDVNTQVENICRDFSGCFNLKIKHNVGREASKITEEIESLKTKHSLMKWTDDRIPLGNIDSMKASTSTSSTDHHDFKSREKTFMEALKALDPSHKSHMVALCGMGGVGKTTMMQDLKNRVKETKMYDFIVEAVIGEKTDPINIQQAVADYLSITLEEKTKSARADMLRKMFKVRYAEYKKKILVILDDVWESIDLNDIGLSPLPDQGVDFKVLLTSRNRDVCINMGVNGISIIDVKVLTDLEAQKLFHQFVKDSKDVDLDPDFEETGVQIVAKCQGLPIAIKTIALNLKGQSKDVWDDALDRLKHNNLDEIVYQVFEISYNNLKTETRSVFLLCGLYPEHFRIPKEDLVRYGWGLKFFKKVYAIKQARNRLNTCIQQLINANLLIGAHCIGWVKMHDLVRTFVLSIISKGEHHSIVNHSNMAEWPTTSESCKRLSLTCNDMREFPGEYFRYPNLTLLKIICGDNLLRHAQDFYGGMENLQVIAYESTHYLAFSKSLRCSTVLRTLCLEYCSLKFDYSIIGNLLNLEVLSFAHSGIEKLPSIIGNLTKLKVLDLTGCYNLLIDSGVFKGLVNLEELYARVQRGKHRKAIRFSDGRCNDLTKCSKNLCALEVELFENNAQPMIMSFEKLERFNISLGCFSDTMGENLLPLENKLMLVTSKGELLGSRMNNLFVKTKVLYLQVNDMNDLEEVDVDVDFLHPCEQSLFRNLRFLSVSKCSELRYLFTPRVAAALSKLENLRICSCPNLETLIQFKNSGSETITFPKLKCLKLWDLTNLSSLCHTSNVIDLPQLVELELYNLPKITDLYPKKKFSSCVSSNISTAQPLLKEEVVISRLKKIIVGRCPNLVNLFPINLGPLMSNLEELDIRDCSSIEVLFNVDLECLIEIKGGSNMRSIEVRNLERLKQVWRVKNVNNSNLPINSFQALESLKMEDCMSFRNLFTPAIASFDLGSLTNISMVNVGKTNELDGVHQDQEMINKSEEEILEVIQNIPNVAISSQVLFEIEIDNATSSKELGNNQQALLLPHLKHIELKKVDEMHHVWKCNNWDKLFIVQQPPNTSFHNLTSIFLSLCDRIKYLISPRIFELLFNLKDVKIEYCDGIEEVVSNRDDENNEMSCTSLSTHSSMRIFHLLDSLILNHLRSLRQIGGGEEDVRVWSLCQYSRRIEISDCKALSSLIPSHAARHLQNLEELVVKDCYSMKEVFESEGTSITSSQNIFHFVPQLCNLKKVEIDKCHRLRYLFTSTLESLRQLRELSIASCDDIQVIVKEEDDTSKALVVFPCLKSVKLSYLPNLEGFFKGMNEFRWHLLEEVEIKNCPQMTRFTHGHSTSPVLKYIRTKFGKYNLKYGLNFHMTTASQQTPSSSQSGPNSCSPLQTVPWSFSDLIEIRLRWRNIFRNNYIVPYNEFQQLKNLEKINVSLQDDVEEVFQVLTGRTNSDSNEPLLINLPNLREVLLDDLPRLECIWKSNQHTILHFPNLTALSISGCPSLGYVLSCSMVGSLLQLQSLYISFCSAMKVILKEEEEAEWDAKAKNEIVFPSLKSLKLVHLSNLEGFCLQGHKFQCPSLLTLEIYKCPSIQVFTQGKSSAPKLKVIDTEYGTFDAKQDPNTIITIQNFVATGTQLEGPPESHDDDNDYGCQIM